MGNGGMGNDNAILVVAPTTTLGREHVEGNVRRATGNENIGIYQLIKLLQNLLFQVDIFINTFLYKVGRRHSRFQVGLERQGMLQTILETTLVRRNAPQLQGWPNAGNTTLDGIGVDKGIATHHVMALGQKDGGKRSANRAGSHNAHLVGRDGRCAQQKGNDCYYGSGNWRKNRLIFLELVIRCG